MRVQVRLVLVIGLVSAGCVSSPERLAACQRIAPASAGWIAIASPPNATELLSLVRVAPDAATYWFRGREDMLRACVYERCGSVGYDFQNDSGDWSGAVDAFTVCH